MTGQIGTLSMDGIFLEDGMLSVKISGTVTVDDVGKALAIDTAAANTFKLAGDNDKIIGRLETYENRLVEGVKVGTMSTGISFQFLTNPDAVSSPTNEVPVVGSYICGATKDDATKGYVQTIAASGQERWLVVEIIDSTHLVALKV